MNENIWNDKRMAQKEIWRGARLFDVSQSSYTLTPFNARGRPLEKLGMCCGDDQLQTSGVLPPSIPRAVLTGEPFSDPSLVLDHSLQSMLLQVQHKSNLGQKRI